MVSCKSEQYTLIEPVKGKIVSVSDKNPINAVKIYIDKNAFNAFDTISTKNDGRFFINKVTINNYKNLRLQREISYNLSIEKKGYKKVMIDVRNFRNHEQPTAKDTIDLGIIYLHKLQQDIVKNKESSINNDWSGTYSGSFLRMKGEYADPRGWGQIKLEIGKASAKFHLDSYLENIERTLKIAHTDSKEIQFAAEDDKNKKLTMQLDHGKYRMSGNLIEQIVGVKETYDLKKSK